MTVRNWNLKPDRTELVMQLAIFVILASTAYAIISTLKVHYEYTIAIQAQEPCHRDEFGRRQPCHDKEAAQ